MCSARWHISRLLHSTCELLRHASEAERLWRGRIESSSRGASNKLTFAHREVTTRERRVDSGAVIFGNASFYCFECHIREERRWKRCSNEPFYSKHTVRHKTYNQNCAMGRGMEKSGDVLWRKIERSVKHSTHKTLIFKAQESRSER